MRVASVPAEIRTQNLLNTRLQHHHIPAHTVSHQRRWQSEAWAGVSRNNRSFVPRIDDTVTGPSAKAKSASPSDCECPLLIHGGQIKLLAACLFWHITGSCMCCPSRFLSITPPNSQRAASQNCVTWRLSATSDRTFSSSQYIASQMKGENVHALIEIRRGLISLLLYKEYNKLRNWKNIFTLHIPLWAPHTDDFVVLTSLTHPRRNYFTCAENRDYEMPKTYQHPYVLPHHLREGQKKNDNKPRAGYLVSQLRFKQKAFPQHKNLQLYL
jgi:hypothetical protein